MQLVNGIFAAANPFLARLFDYWQMGKVLISTYAYTAEWNTLAANATGAQPTSGITIDPDIDFLLQQISFVAWLHPGAIDQLSLSPANMLLSITEKAGANLFTDTDHPIACWTGQTGGGNSIYTLPVPRLLKGNNSLLIKLTDQGGTATHCYLGLEGIRIAYVNTNRAEVFPFATRTA